MSPLINKKHADFSNLIKTNILKRLLWVMDCARHFTWIVSLKLQNIVN